MLATSAQPPSASAPARPQPAAGADTSQPAAGFAVLLAGLMPPPVTAGAPPCADCRANVDAAAEIERASGPTAGSEPATVPESPPLPGVVPSSSAAGAGQIRTTAPAVAGTPPVPVSTDDKAAAAAAVPLLGAGPHQPEASPDPAADAGVKPTPGQASAPPGISLPMPAPPASATPAPVGPASLLTADPSPAPFATDLVNVPGQARPAVGPSEKPPAAVAAGLPAREASDVSIVSPPDAAAAVPADGLQVEAVASGPVPTDAPDARPGNTAGARSGSDGPAAHPATTAEPQPRATSVLPTDPATQLPVLPPNGPEQVSSASAVPHPASASAPATHPGAQIAIQIAAALPHRIERLFVQLEPPALGRVEVRLEFSRDNRVTALIAADRHDTLDLLQRDSRGLERTLQDAGVRLGDGGLSFSLRQEQGQDRRGAGGFTPSHLEPAAGRAAAVRSPDPLQPLGWIGVPRVLDIRI
jgi:flagellar hook-length control protein FliK